MAIELNEMALTEVICIRMLRIKFGGKISIEKAAVADKITSV